MGNRKLDNRISLLLLTFFIVGCNEVKYFSHNRPGYFYELRLYPNGYFEEYSCAVYESKGCLIEIDNPDRVDYEAEVFIGRYYQQEDSLFLAYQNWEFIGNDEAFHDSLLTQRLKEGVHIFKDTAYKKRDSIIFKRFQIDKNDLIQNKRNWEVFFDTTSTVISNGKNKKLRRVEKRDSIKWQGRSYEFCYLSKWYDYPNLDEKNESLDSIFEIGDFAP